MPALPLSRHCVRHAASGGLGSHRLLDMAIKVAVVCVCVWQVVAEEFTAEVAAAGQTDEPDIPLFAYAVEHDEVRPHITHDAHCAQ